MAEIKSAEADLENAHLTHELEDAKLSKARNDLEAIIGLVQKLLRPQKDLDEAMMTIRSQTTALEKAGNQVEKVPELRSRNQIREIWPKAPSPYLHRFG